MHKKIIFVCARFEIKVKEESMGRGHVLDEFKLSLIRLFVVLHYKKPTKLSKTLNCISYFVFRIVFRFVVQDTLKASIICRKTCILLY